MLFKLERNLYYLRKNKLICLKYYIFLNNLFKQKLRNRIEIGVFLWPLWHAFVVFCTVFCGSVGVHALMKKPPSFWRVVLVFIIFYLIVFISK
jgi:hypothetical protein